MSTSLFILHSPIAEVTLIRLVLDRKVSLDKLKILTVRSYLPFSKTVKGLDIVSIHNIWPFSIQAFKKRPDFWTFWKTRQLFRESVLKITDSDPFTLYAPYLYFVPVYQILHMPQCKCVYYYEEGIGSFGPIERFETFRTRDEKNILLKLFSRLNYGSSVPLKLKFFDFLHPKYKGAFAFSNQCFPVKTRILMEWPKSEDFRDKINAEEYLKYQDAHILLLDTFYSLHGFGWEALFSPLLLFVNWAKKKRNQEVVL